jgi:hypothetical protein
MPRFVLLCHECPPGYGKPSHWDLMLEAGDTLRTWNLFDIPTAWKDPDSLDKTASYSGTCLSEVDHRIDFLEFEGPLTNNRGYVTRIDRGEYIEHESTPEVLGFDLFGERLHGVVRLERPFGIVCTCHITAKKVD